MANKYPEDEFDVAARERSTQGAHRKKESNLKWWIALVAILILAPLVGLGLIRLNTMDVRTTAPTPSQIAPTVAESVAVPEDAENSQAESSEQEEPGAPAAEEPTAEEPSADETSPEPSEEPTAEADKTRPVSLLNASGITGYAAQKQKTLLEAGFTNVAIGNYRHAAPAQSQIYYPKASDLQTVQAIGESLGITQFTENARATGGDQIVVVLAR